MKNREELPIKKGQAFTDEVREIATQMGVLRSLNTSCELARQYFPTRRDIRVILEVDPEENSESLTIEISVEGTPEDVANQYDRFIDAFLERIPADDQLKIGLLASAV